MFDDGLIISMYFGYGLGMMRGVFVQRVGVEEAWLLCILRLGPHGMWRTLASALWGLTAAVLCTLL